MDGTAESDFVRIFMGHKRPIECNTSYVLQQYNLNPRLQLNNNITLGVVLYNGSYDGQ